MELLSLNTDERLPAGVPVVIFAAMSVLGDAEVAFWGRGKRFGDTVLLVDLPLLQHLDLWLEDPASQFRYEFLRLESFGRVVPVLVGRIWGPEGFVSPWLVRPLSHAGVGIHKAALEEHYTGSSQVVRDVTLTEPASDLLGLALAHLAGEEVRFGPYGRRRLER